MIACSSEILRQFRVPLEVTVRRCIREDLSNLEWHGLFAEHREIMESAFADQARGNGAMLVADVNGYPVGQIWIDIRRKREESVGILWALRVYPFLQRLGIGTALMEAAEDLLREIGFEYSELGVEKSNHDARRLYEHLGYRHMGERVDTLKYKGTKGDIRTMTVDQWILRKKLMRNERHRPHLVTEEPVASSIPE